MRSNENPSIDLIVPVFNEQESIDPFMEVVANILKETGCPHRVIFIDDGSRDQTLEALKQAKAKYQNITIISLSRNFGKEAALTAGLDYCKGDVVVPIDVDLQDPPELIHKFLEQWRQGFDVVYGVRGSRQADGFLKRGTASLFYSIFNRMSEIQIPSNSGDYRLMDRRVVAEINKLRERNRFMKGLMAWPGFRATGVTFERPERAKGQTSWNYWKLFNFAIDGLTSFSTVPLRLWTYIGGFIALTSLLYAFYIVVRVLLWGVVVPGYASTMVAIFFIGGVQLLTLGMLGEYLGRLFNEVKARPLYVIDVIEE